MRTITVSPTTALGLAKNAREGDGFYNNHSQLQQSTVSYARPLLRRAAESVELDDKNGMILLADYGSSQGKNSMEPLNLAITIMRWRMRRDVPIGVVHNDQPANDFSSLFEVLESSPRSYHGKNSNVFSYASGRSFYERLFPDNSISLGWSSWSVQWLSEAPALIPDHIWCGGASEKVADLFRQRAKEDWDRFLWHRSHELHPGGYLVIHAPCANDEGISGWEISVDMVNTVLQEMVEQRLLRQREYERMTLPVMIRSLNEYLSTFFSGEMRNSLRLKDYSLFYCDDPIWNQYERTQDVAAFAESYAGVLFAVFAPPLFGGLDESRSLMERKQMKNAFYEQMRFAIQMNPEVCRSRKLVVTLLITKR